jgi:hypothetical protein
LASVSPEVEEGRRRFARALATATPIEHAPLLEPGSTANMRLMVAYLAVHACERQHFADERDHAAFSGWLATLRTHAASGAVTAAIANLPPPLCRELAQRLAGIARDVARR